MGTLKIMNGGLEAGLLKAAKESGCNLSQNDEQRLQYLESLPKNEWIELDKGGRAKTDTSENQGLYEK